MWISNSEIWKLSATWPEEQQRALVSWQAVQVGDFVRLKHTRTGEETDAIIRFIFPYTFKAHFTDKSWLESIRARKTEWEVLEVLDHPAAPPPPEGASSGQYLDYAVNNHIELRFRYRDLKGHTTRRRVQPLYTFVAKTTGNPIVLTRDYYMRGGDFRAFIIPSLSEIKLGEPFVVRDKLMYKDVKEGLDKISQSYALLYPDDPEYRQERLESNTLYQGLSEYKNHLAIQIFKESEELEPGTLVKLRLGSETDPLYLKVAGCTRGEDGEVAYWGTFCHEDSQPMLNVLKDASANRICVHSPDILSCELISYPEVSDPPKRANAVFPPNMLMIKTAVTSIYDSEAQKVSEIFGGKEIVRIRKISDYPRVHRFLKGLFGDVQDITVYEIPGQHPCTNLKFIAVDSTLEPLRKEHSLAHEYAHVHYQARDEERPRAIAKKFRAQYGLPDSYLRETLHRYNASRVVPEGFIQ